MWFYVDPQAFWDKVFLKALFEKLFVVVCLHELVIEPVIALPQLEKLCCFISRFSRGRFQTGISVRASGGRARSARLRLGRRNASDADILRASFDGMRRGGSVPLRVASVHGRSKRVCVYRSRHCNS